MKQELRLFLVALQFLTRVPIPRWVGFEPAWLQSCLRHFPSVGACVGGFTAAVLCLGLIFWTPTVAAVVAVAATLWLTGAFHEDGLADTMDGLGGSVSRERSLEIMKDSRIGTYGAAGLVVALTLKVAILAALGSVAGVVAAAGAVWGAALSRAAPVWIVWRLNYAGDAAHAKAKPLATQVTNAGVAMTLAWLAVIGGIVLVTLICFSSGVSVVNTCGPILAVFLAVTAVALWGQRWLLRRLGGFTGDTLGAIQQIAENVALLVWLAMVT